MNRHVGRGTDGISLLNRNTHKLYYGYAVEDTENRQNGRSKNSEDYIWKITEKHETAVADMLEKQFGISEKKLTDGLVKLAELPAEKFIPKYMNKLAEKCMELNVTLTKEKQKSFSEVLKKSSAYIMLKRCGYDTKNVFFDSLKSFDSRFITVIGTALKNISANAVLQVEKVVGIPINQKRSNENDRITEEKSQEWNRVHFGRKDTDISPEFRGGRNGDNRVFRKHLTEQMKNGKANTNS